MSMTDDKPSNMLIWVNYVNIFKKIKFSICIMVLRINTFVVTNATPQIIIIVLDSL